MPIKHFRELDFTVAARIESHRVKFEIFDIVGWQDEAMTTRPLWQKAGAESSPDPVQTLEESEPYLHGEVKWDGCSNWHFDQQDSVMLHGCSRADIQRFGDIMGACWDWTGELLPTWNP